MTTTTAMKCDANGCSAKSLEPSGGDFVPKGWTHARIVTRAGWIEVDLCEKHSAPLHTVVELARKDN